MQEDRIDKKANAKRYSWIGHHGVYLVEMDGNRKVNTLWSCNVPVKYVSLISAGAGLSWVLRKPPFFLLIVHSGRL